MSQERVKPRAKPADKFSLSLGGWSIELPASTNRVGLSDTTSLESARPAC